MPSIVDSSGAAVAPSPRPDLPDAGRFASEEIRRRNRDWLTVYRTLGKSRRQTAKVMGVPWKTFSEALRAAEAAEPEAAGPAGDGPAIAGTDLTADDLVYLQETYPLGTPIGDDPEVQEFYRAHDVAHLTRAEVADRRRARRLEQAEIAGEVA